MLALRRNYRNAKLTTISLATLLVTMFIFVCYYIFRNGVPNSLPLRIENQSSLKTDTLVLYSYHETPNARENLVFFLQHGLHDAADFVFIFQGPTDMNLHKVFNEGRPNIRYIQRDNTCFDLGAFGKVLRMDSGALIKKYDKFIMMNASLRGPFIPIWSKDCWSDIFTRRITDKTKLVGTTYNCSPKWGRHLQSMIQVTDRLGLEVLLKTTYATCYDQMHHAILGEAKTTGHMRKAGYGVEAIFTPYHAYENYTDTCVHDDVNLENAYFGTNIHPFETVFFKANRGFNEKQLELFTKWYDMIGYSSYEACSPRASSTTTL